MAVKHLITLLFYEFGDNEKYTQNVMQCISTIIDEYAETDDMRTCIRG